MSAKAITKLLSMIIAGAQSLSGGNATANPDVGDNPPTSGASDVWATIERISQTSSPNAIIRVALAQEAGQSELIAALVQGLRTCTGDVGDCVNATIARVGGLSTRNLVSLEALTKALEAVGVPAATISEALDAYSTAVADAVTGGTIPEQYAAATLADRVPPARSTFRRSRA